MRSKRVSGLLGVALIVVLSQHDRPLAQGSSGPSGENQAPLRIASGGVGWGGYARVSLWLLSSLKDWYPARDMWLD